MMRVAVVMSWHPSHELAVTEALRLRQVLVNKGLTPHRYVVRKRRSLWPLGGLRVWNQGRHDAWYVLTDSDIPDRDTSNLSRPR